MNRFEHAVSHRAARRGRALRRAVRRPVGDDPGRDARRRGRGHRRLPQLVELHPPLHRHPRIRVRLRVRPAPRPVGLRPLPGARATSSSLPTSTCCGPVARAHRKNWPRSSTATSPIRASGTPAWRSSRGSSTPPRTPHAPPGASDAKRGRDQASRSATSTPCSTTGLPSRCTRAVAHRQVEVPGGEPTGVLVRPGRVQHVAGERPRLGPPDVALVVQLEVVPPCRGVHPPADVAGGVALAVAERGEVRAEQCGIDALAGNLDDVVVLDRQPHRPSRGSG